MVEHKISVIVPTIGRPENLRQLFDSLIDQTHKPGEVIVADGSEGTAVKSLLADPCWKENNLTLRHVKVYPPNAVRQRQVAISESESEFILLLDDDVVLEPLCVERMYVLLEQNSDVVAVTSDFNNQVWPQPTRAWRAYIRIFHGLKGGEWQGKIVGPLLRFGYNPSPLKPVPMDWLGAGNSLIRRDVYDRSGGFSEFFLHRCTMNEDVDLGIKLRREGCILLCPTARMGHFHAASGRVKQAIVAEDDLYNRYMVLHHTMVIPALRSFVLVSVFFMVESSSNLIGALRRGDFEGFRPRLVGRLRALGRILSVPHESV